MLNINEIKANICKVSLEEFESLLNRGLKPTKALTRLGADPKMVALIGNLSLAITAEEIDAVYDSPVESCMQGYPVGQFYSSNGIGVLYTPAYRILVSISGKGVAPRGYGYDANQIDQLLRPLFNPEEYLGPGREFTSEKRVVKVRTGESKEQLFYELESAFGIRSLMNASDSWSEGESVSYEVGDTITEDLFGEPLTFTVVGKVWKEVFIMKEEAREVNKPVLHWDGRCYLPSIDFPWEDSDEEMLRHYLGD